MTTIKCFIVALYAMTVYAQNCRAQSLTEKKQSIGVPPSNPPSQDIPALKELSSQTPRVVPNPGQYDPAYLTAVNQLHDFQIKDLMSRVSSLETYRTVIFGIAVGLALFAGFLTHFWKRIFRMLLEESEPPKIAT